MCIAMRIDTLVIALKNRSGSSNISIKSYIGDSRALILLVNVIEETVGIEYESPFH